MIHRGTRTLTAVLATSLTLLALSMMALPSHADSGSLGTIKAIEGGASSSSAAQPAVDIKGDTGSRHLNVNSSLVAGDHVLSGHDMTVTVALRDGSQIVLAADSEVSLDEVADRSSKRGTKLGLFAGMVHAQVQKIYSKAAPFVVTTGNCVMAVRGTEFVVDREASGRATLHTLEGTVAIARTMADLNSAKGSRLVKAGSTSAMNPGRKLPEAAKRFNPKTLDQYLATRAPRIAKVVVAHRETRIAQLHAAEVKREGLRKARSAYKPPKPKKVKAK